MAEEQIGVRRKSVISSRHVRSEMSGVQKDESKAQERDLSWGRKFRSH